MNKEQLTKEIEKHKNIINQENAETIIEKYTELIELSKFKDLNLERIPLYDTYKKKLEAYKQSRADKKSFRSEDFESQVRIRRSIPSILIENSSIRRKSREEIQQMLFHAKEEGKKEARRLLMSDKSRLSSFPTTGVTTNTQSYKNTPRKAPNPQISVFPSTSRPKLRKKPFFNPLKQHLFGDTPYWNKFMTLCNKPTLYSHQLQTPIRLFKSQTVDNRTR
jgi:hypothetical protein